MNRQLAEARGRKAESLAAWWLRLKGWRILARRTRVPGGEVDLIAKRGRIVAFVEVKLRSTADAAAWALVSIGCAASLLPQSGSRPALQGSGTTFALTPCSSFLAACHATSPMSGTGDKGVSFE